MDELMIVRDAAIQLYSYTAIQLIPVRHQCSARFGTGIELRRVQIF
jgi:hypothetical protein